MCVSEAGGYFCETHPVIDAQVVDVPATVDSPLVDATPDTFTIDAPTLFTYTATVAECIDPTNPDPGHCRSSNGNFQLVADAHDSTTGDPWNAYVRFDLDAGFAGQTVTTATLELTVTDASLAPSGSSGDIWQVQSFDLASLSTTVPGNVGASPIALAQANVVKLQTLSFAIPTTLIAPSGSVYLAVITTDTDGVNYWNLDGTTPPRLVVRTN